MKKLLLGLSILILVSCGEEKVNSETVEAPKEAQFEWDLSKKRKFVYAYSQVVNASNKMDKSGDSDKTYLEGQGFLNVTVKENNTAELSLTDLDIAMVNFDLEGNPGDTMTQEVPAKVVQGMKPNGSFNGTGSDVIFDMLFPLPNKTLNEGESDAVPMSMPFNAYGSMLTVTGQNNLVFAGYEDFEGRKCAVFKGTIDISNLDVPQEITGTYECATTGNATYYFDEENGCYVGADIQMDMHAIMADETKNNGGMGSYMEMTSQNVFQIRLERIEE